MYGNGRYLTPARLECRSRLISSFGQAGGLLSLSTACRGTVLHNSSKLLFYHISVNVNPCKYIYIICIAISSQKKHAPLYIYSISFDLRLPSLLPGEGPGGEVLISHHLEFSCSPTYIYSTLFELRHPSPLSGEGLGVRLFASQ